MKNSPAVRISDTAALTFPVKYEEMLLSEDSPCPYAHCHGITEIILVKSGSLSLIINNTSYDLYAGEIILINSNEMHSLMPASEKSEYISLKFSPHLLCAFGGTENEKQFTLPFFSPQQNISRVFGRDFVRASGTEALISDIKKELSEKTAGYELSVHADIMKIMRSIISAVSASSDEKAFVSGSGMVCSMSRILGFINENFKDCDEKTVSENFSISYSYFSRSFKQIMNMSFKEYINFLKINEAQRLLLSTDCSVAEIASGLGFSSASHFINVFGKQKSCSPAQFRKNFR